MQWRRFLLAIGINKKFSGPQFKAFRSNGRLVEGKDEGLDDHSIGHGSTGARGYAAARSCNFLLVDG